MLGMYLISFIIVKFKFFKIQNLKNCEGLGKFKKWINRKPSNLSRLKIEDDAYEPWVNFNWIGLVVI
jgi:hypothetical protein